MRLVCPNCSAQYEIDGSMIPEEGRDVQCSNCGHTWFELPAPAAAAGPDTGSAAEVEDEFDSPPAYDLDDDDSFEVEEDVLPSSRRESVPDFISREDFEDDGVRETSVFSDWDNDEPDVQEGKPDAQESEPEKPAEATDEPEDDDETSAVIRAVTAAAEADTAPEPEETADASAPDDRTEDEPISDADDDSEDDTLTSVASAVAATPRRPADAAALDILREEAERELSRRAAPSEPLETQSDLGLDDIRNRRTPSRALRARMAHLGEDLPEEEPKADVPEPAPAPRSAPEEDEAYEEPRRDLLPDIDEINSTLKASGHGAEAAEAVQRSGFRYGFLLMLFLTIAAIFAYAQAPAIARALPQTESTMISYVDWANGVRDWIDGLIGN